MFCLRALSLYINNVLPCAGELVEEADIVLGEHAEVLHLVLQVRDALDAHAESVASIDAAIDAVCVENCRIYHAAAKYLKPTTAFTHRAALASANGTADIHLGRGFREGEVAWAETNLCLRSEELLGKEEEHLLEVCEAYILVDIQAFNLMEEAMGACTHGFVAINTARAKYADGRLCLLHHTRLHAAGVRAKDDVGM